MKLLDRYILKNFLVSYAMCTGVFLLFYIVLDLTGKLDEFLKDANGWTAMERIFSCYVYALPVIYLNFSPLLTLAAAMFVLTRMVRHNEHLPILASGQSLYRALMPIYWAAVGITALIFIVQEVVIPNNAAQIRDANEVIQKNVMWVLDFAHQDDYNLVLFGKYNIKDKTARECGLYRRDENGKDSGYIQAESASWKLGKPRNGKSSKAWVFENCTVWEFDQTGLSCGQKFSMPSYELDLDSTTLRPEMVRTDGKEMMNIATRDIYRKWKKEPTRVPLGVMFHSRLAFPFLNLILLLLGIPHLFIGDSSNAFRGVGLSLLSGAALFLTVFLCQDLGAQGNLSPVIAAWLPVALFGATGLILFDSIRT